jgi:hypothetical protein
VLNVRGSFGAARIHELKDTADIGGETSEIEDQALLYVWGGEFPNKQFKVEYKWGR